jgi:dCMP deaminase
MLIINCGIKKVICEKKYHRGDESEQMFKDAGVELEFFEEDYVNYENQ